MRKYTNFIAGNKYDLMIYGSDNGLEASLLLPQNEINYCMIICHPNSSDGGTMNNKVVTTVMRTCQKLNVATLRFNFRSAGKSRGEYDFGKGEQDDLIAIINWVKNNLPNNKILLSGFSFGSFVSYSVASKSPIEGLITIAPAVCMWDYSIIDEPSCPWIVIHGTEDELVSVKEVGIWVQSLLSEPDFIIVPEASHFFHGKLIGLQDIVTKFLKSILK